MTSHSSSLGARTFFAFCHPNDQCGANGLPLTPNSIRILGRFQELKHLDHYHLCRYIDITRSKHERLIVVSEHYVDNVKLAVKRGHFASDESFLHLAYEALSGLNHLHHRGYVHRNLSPDNFLLTSKGRLKMSDYGLYHMTGCGGDVAFPIGTLKYLAPEIVVRGPIPDLRHSSRPKSLIGPKSDVWSLGIILLEVYLQTEFFTKMSLQQISRKLINMISSGASPMRVLTQELTDQSRLVSMPHHVTQFFVQCLTLSSAERPSTDQLMGLAMFHQFRSRQENIVSASSRLLTSELRSLNLELADLDSENLAQDNDDGDDILAERSLFEVYYLWCLSGGSLETVLRKNGLVKTKPPVIMMPGFVLDDGEPFGAMKDLSSLYDNRTVLLSMDQLRERISEMDEVALYPLLEEEHSHAHAKPTPAIPSSTSTSSFHETATLPAIIKERDVGYQFHRMLLYHRLLLGYPTKRPRIWVEARLDTPPYWRHYVWAALLDVSGDYRDKYDATDKETATKTDRQIEVDIPRCHQYDELLSSPAGHSKLKRVLKAWVVINPQYVYWQGLDSLTAPFLSLNFNDEALAFACLAKFIPKYLNKFFLKDNSKVIQEYLCVFAHLIAFHDPELSTHLDGIGFIPDLYAIPWFLTMYAHVFPLHKIYHLWDTLILGNSSFPLCIGVAILQQLKLQHNLMSLGFNECILLFSDMPQIDIDRCVQDSIKIFCNTPKSSTYRQYARTPAAACKTNGESATGVFGVRSYYSPDYNLQPANPLSMDPVPLDELRQEKCPRISADDLMELGELKQRSPTRTPTKPTKQSKPRIIVVDIRNQDDYMRGCIPGSVSIPYTAAFNTYGELVPCTSVQKLNSHRSQVKVIMGSRGKNVVYFANELVRLGYQKVCILHKGVDVLQQTGVLTVSSGQW